MNNGRVDFSKCGSDEVIGSCPLSAGLPNLARVLLTKHNNDEVLNDAEARGTYIAYLAAKKIKLDGIPDLEPETVTVEDLFMFNTDFDFDLITPETPAESKYAEQEIDENPTDTLPESSKG